MDGMFQIKTINMWAKLVFILNSTVSNSAKVTAEKCNLNGVILDKRTN